MSSESTQKWRNNTKAYLVQSLGGECNKCGYAACIKALEFHHREEYVKDFTIGQVISHPRKLELIIEEVKKCILLCCRCHRELHAGLWSLEDIKINEWQDVFTVSIGPSSAESDNANILTVQTVGETSCNIVIKKATAQKRRVNVYRLPAPTGRCPICNKDVFGTITCSRNCAAKKRAKCAWPTKEELVALKQTHTRVAIAKMLGVTEMAVRKREKKYGIYKKAE